MIRHFLNRIAAIAIGYLLFGYSPNLAAEPQSSVSDSGDIVVTGKRVDDETIRREAKLFVRKISASPIDGQISRWKVPICPKALGVDEKIASLVIRRVINLAKRVNAPVAKGSCKTNLLVTFTPDGNGLVEAILKRDPGAITVSEPQELKIIRDSPLPVRWWYGSESEGADGHPLSSSPSAALLGIDIPTNGYQKYLGTYGSSLIGTNLRVNIESVTILVDVSRADGYSLTAVADYVAFVALARIRVAANFDGAPSILALFSSDLHDRRQLSDWDIAYLSALYRIPVDRTADEQRKLMAGKIYDFLRK